MTRILSILGGKGGVGKTFLTANLGVAMSDLGHDVLLLDSNITTPNLGLHLGVPLYPKTLQDILKGKANVDEAIYRHPSGLKILPAGISLTDLRGIDPIDIPGIVLDLLGRVETILIDSAAGLGREAMAALESSDELITITNPDLPSVTDALKAAKLAKEMGLKNLGVVVNRVTRRPHQMTNREISTMLDLPILGEIPEDVAVQEAISLRTPVVHYKPRSRASRAVYRLAHQLLGYHYSEPWYYKFFSF